MRVSTAVLVAAATAAAAVPVVAAAPEGGKDGVSKTTTARFEDAEAFEADLCAAMVDDIFGAGTAADQVQSGDAAPLCATGNVQSDGEAAAFSGDEDYCDIELSATGRSTRLSCEAACAAAGATCIQAWDDDNDQACEYGEEVTCDTSLYSQICRCESDVIAYTRHELETTTVADDLGDACNAMWAVRFGPASKDDDASEFQLNVDFSSGGGDAYVAGAGVYTIAARVRVQKSYDGEEMLLHSRWYDSSGNELGITTGGFPSQRGKWETISVQFDTGDVVPASAQLYFGYPNQADIGHVDLRQLSLLDDQLHQFVTGGDLACGDAPLEYSEVDSRGKYAIREENTEELCFITQADVDGMCGDMVQLSGSDGTYVSGQGFTAEQCADACIAFAGFTCNGFAIDGDHDCHLFEDANECVVDNGEASMDYYEMSRECGELVTCQFTIDNHVDAVYFNNDDITGTVTSSDANGLEPGLDNWRELKEVSFRWDGVGTAVLAIAGHEFDADGSCSISGLLLGCSSDNPDSDWNFVRSDTTGAFLSGWSGDKDKDPAEDSVGHEWYALDYDASDWPGVCTSTSAFYCCDDGDITVGNGQVGLEAEKVWPCNCETDAFFRITVEGSEYKDIVNSEGANPLVCEWEESHPDKKLEGCTQDGCHDFASLASARRACEGYGPGNCGGVTYNGAYETRLGDVLVDSPSGEASWLMGDCSERDFMCEDGSDDHNWGWDQWADSLGYTCEQYAANHYCTEDGGYGRGWQDEWKTFADYATWCSGDNCYDATDVCCACGGGLPSLTEQVCFQISDPGECLSSYDSRSEWASPCCLIDSRVNGNSCEPQAFIEQEGLYNYATCTAWEGNAGWCEDSCMGENTCDYWVGFSDSFTCANLETEMGCDCSGCLCPRTVPWRIVVTEAYNGDDSVTLTELSFLDQYGTLLSEGEGPAVSPSLTAADGTAGDADLLADGETGLAGVTCSPLPCIFTYELQDSPSAFQLGYASDYGSLASMALVQYFDEQAGTWITTWAGEPTPPCGEVKDYANNKATCDNVGVVDIDTEPLEKCPATCLKDGYSCDYWIGAVGEFTCESLEHDSGCNCWQCACDAEGPVTEPPFFVETTTQPTNCDWWNC